METYLGQEMPEGVTAWRAAEAAGQTSSNVGWDWGHALNSVIDWLTTPSSGQTAAEEDNAAKAVTDLQSKFLAYVQNQQQTLLMIGGLAIGGIVLVNVMKKKS